MPPARVLLYLDGREIDHDTSPPYLFKWDTRRATDGLHLLDARGSRTRRPDRALADSRQRRERLRAARGDRSATRSPTGRPCPGTQHWLVDTSGTVAAVELSVDGATRATLTKAPYAWDWQASAETPGPHRLSVRVTGADGAFVEQALTVTVAS